MDNRLTRTGTLIFVLALVAFALAFRKYNNDAALAMATDQAKWHMEAMNTQDAKTYSAHYRDGRCDVYVRKDGLGAEIETTYEIKGDTVKQAITILGVPAMDGLRTPIVAVESTVLKGRVPLLLTDYQDVFSNYYLPDVKFLPDDAKASFLGNYGIR